MRQVGYDVGAAAGMRVCGATGAVALGALGGWFFKLHPPAEPASTIWGDVGLIATLHGASRSSLGLDGGNKGSGSGWSADGQRGSGGRGDMLGDFDEPFSHRMEGPHSAVEAVIACVVV